MSFEDLDLATPLSVLDRRGEIVEYIGTSMDVTKHRPPEEERRGPERFRTCVDNYAVEGPIDTESWFRLIVNKTPALIYSARPDGYIDFFNQQCVEFLGLLAKWRAALESGESFTAECRVR